MFILLNVFVKLALLCLSTSYSQSLSSTTISMQQKIKAVILPFKLVHSQVTISHIMVLIIKLDWG